MHVPRGLCGENASAADGLDLVLGEFAEKFGLNDNGLFRQASLAQELVVTLESSEYIRLIIEKPYSQYMTLIKVGETYSLDKVDHRGFAVGGVLVL